MANKKRKVYFSSLQVPHVNKATKQSAKIALSFFRKSGELLCLSKLYQNWVQYENHHFPRQEDAG